MHTGIECSDSDSTLAKINQRVAELATRGSLKNWILAPDIEGIVLNLFDDIRDAMADFQVCRPRHLVLRFDLISV